MHATQQKRTSTKSVQALWEQYHETGDSALRDRLVLSLAPMVKYIVYRKVRGIPARIEVEDFISCGLEALIKSIDRYDPDRGATLEQFVWTRIHGAVLDELRRNDWAPRSVRRWEREIAKIREKFIADNGYAPSKAELAAELGVTPEQLDDHLQDSARADVTSLNTLVLGEDEDASVERIDTLASDDDEGDPERQAISEAARSRFRAAFAVLPERERKIAILLYVHNLTQREIAEVMGVTESRISQILSQMRSRLAEQLAHEGDLFAIAA